MANRKLSFWQPLFACLLIALVVGVPQAALAENWQAKLYEERSPSGLVGVDKKKGSFFYFEKKSPLRARYAYPCVTGQLAGDKQQVNDLKTPEGIYFVEYKIASGLDFREYGGIAYTLNYPNPVDRLRGKTGHGIWIHSKGFELVPTKGCVAIGLDDIREVGPSLLPGTPVVLAWEIDGRTKEKNETARFLAGMMKEWSAAWAAKSPKMFEYYDQDAYTRATENFSAFRQNKEKLFKILNFIKIFNREIHVLEGPGYWVTWAEQLYNASNLSTEGIRRLYWQRDKNNKFRIVGMEWTPRDVGMRADFMQGQLVAETSARVASDASSEKPLAPRLDMPEMSEADAVASPPAVPGTRQNGEASQNPPSDAGILAYPAQKPGTPIPEKQEESSSGSASGPALAELAKNLMLAVSDPLVPKRSPDEMKQPAEILWGAGNSIDPAREAAREENTQKNAPAEARHVQEDDQPPARNEMPAENSGENSRLAVLNALEQWDRAFAQRDAGLEKLYDRTMYNRVNKVPRGFSYGQAMIDLRRHFAEPWLVVVSRPWQLEAQGDVMLASCDQLIASSRGIEQGERKLWWKDCGNGEWRIVASSFAPEDVNLYPNYLENVSNEIAATLESWRKAWQNADVDEYIVHYAPNATQQGRQGAQNIRRQKENLWSRAKPVNVQLSGLRITLDKQGVRADMAQYYKDSKGASDKGIKTLLLRYDGRNWLITREDWVNSNQQTNQALP